MSMDGSVCVIAIIFPACRPMYGFHQGQLCGTAMHYLVVPLKVEVSSSIPMPVLCLGKVAWDPI
jgi:hypothetical protein